MELASAGLVTCGSVMVPAPWFRETVETCGAFDVGVHLTLTSEWPLYRWGPVSTVSPASGLIDSDGYFWRDLASLRRHMVLEAAEAELRAQVERAIAAGLRPTHLDAHMAAAMLPGLLELQVRLGREHGLFPVLPRSISWAPEPEHYRGVVNGLAAEGMPVVDHCRGTLPVVPSALAQAWRRTIAELPAGVTHLALHATAPGDFAVIAPDHARWRLAEYRLLRRGGLATLLAEAGAGVTATRALQARWISNLATAKSIGSVQAG